jgi:subtilisin family serine protease
MRSCIWLIASLGTIGCIDSSLTLDSTSQSATSRGEYIVVMDGAPHGRSPERAHVDAVMDRLAAAHGADLKWRYSYAVRGFSARMTSEAAEALAGEPGVAYVEPSVVMTASGVESNATWGLDRIDQRDRPLDTRYNYGSDGSGVTAFVIDTGINTSHSEFAGRIDMSLAAYAVDDGYGFEDCNGHGTHVSATIAGTILGVAKKATIVPVRVLDCEGSGQSSNTIAALDYVAQVHPPSSVVNMSLGGAASDATDAAVRALVGSGVTVVVAAGNENQNACDVSPAREPMAITVGASTNTDARANFSNYGSCVDLFAPGLDITSAWIGGAGATNTISGTSMASPHVAGAAALYLAQNAGSTPARVGQGLVQSATPGKLSGVAGSPNLLLYTTFSGAPPAGGPSVAITAPTDAAQVAPTFAVTVDASGAQSVALALDGTSIGTDTAAPYEFAVANAAAGMHVVEVIATDASGATTRTQITVTVAAGGGDLGLGGGNNPVPPPVGDDGGGCSVTTAPHPLLVAMALFALRRRRRAKPRAAADV